MSKIYDVIILGAGPAGLAAGLYAGRSRLSTLIIEKGQDGGQITAALQHRTRGADQVDAQLGSHDLGQGRLAQTGVAVKERMVQRAAAFTGSAQIHAQIGTQFFLTDEIIQTAGPHALFQRGGAQTGIFRAGCGCGRVLFRRGIPVIIAEKTGCGGRGGFL